MNGNWHLIAGHFWHNALVCGIWFWSVIVIMSLALMWVFRRDPERSFVYLCLPFLAIVIGLPLWIIMLIAITWFPAAR